MDELTKEQRNGLYYLMLAEAQNNIDFLTNNSELLPFTEPFGLCEIVCNLTRDKSKVIEIESLQELMKQKPKGQDCYWFEPRDIEGWKSRVKLLKKAILWTNS